MRTLVVVPAYNEARTLGRVLSDLKSLGHDVLVVDDGSKDETGGIAVAAGVCVMRHVMNRGLGAALGTGLAYARRHDYDMMVTFDADGQHRAVDVPRMLEPLEREEADVVIGSRFLSLARRRMPWHRQIANYVANTVTWVLFGAHSSDSQSGLRAFNRAAIELLEIKSNGMEVSSEIIKETTHAKLRLKEIPIESIYTEYSLSKGQNFLMGVRTAVKLLLQRFF